MDTQTVGGPTLNGHDDRITEAGMAALERLFERLPDSWEITSVQGHKGSAQISARFDVEGPQAQVAAAHDVFLCAQAIGAVVRNLRWERDRSALMEARPLPQEEN